MMDNDLISREFVKKIRSILGIHLKAIILFGSRARGDEKPHSDYDFLILVDERNSEIVQLIRNVEVELLDTYGTLFGSIIYNEAEWVKRKNLPIGINIERDGISL